ncbi:MAG TPA: hypothetical protein VFT55_01875 [Planctomycetota bacterium]|nr:hypothetical protein [Planctomycetota bacterium]
MSCRSLLLLALLSAGCGSPTEVEFGAPRKVSREQRPTTWDAPTRDRLGIRDMAKSSPHEEPQQRWIGSTPSGWEELPPQPKRFRDLFWRVAGNQETECYLSAGVGGGVAENMKRWYTEQNGIQDVPKVESLPVVEMAGRQGRLIELSNSGRAMMIAFLADGPQLTTLKFTGPDDIVKQNREQFLEVAKSLRMVAANGTTNAPGSASGANTGAASAGKPGGDNRWTGTTPSGWEELPPQGFRELLWRIAGNPDTECYLTAGVGGGVASNMTRWYSQQFGIADVPKPEALPEVEIAGRQGRLVELTGTFNKKPGMAMLLAFFVQEEQVTSLKFTGPEDIVKQNREQFLALAKSLRLQSGAAPARGPSTSGQSPAASPHGAPDPGSTSPEITATAPAGWTVKKPSHRVLHYTFGSDGEVYMSQLGGTLRPTLDIWRGELGLPAMSDGEFQALPKVPMLGGEGTLLDAAGNFQSMSGKQIAGARVLIGALVEGGSITFVKLVGKAAEVEAQREGLLQFLASLRRTP